jgi:hypothetical protein
MKTEMDTLFSANSAKKYNCEFCNISCSKKNDWVRHINTRKHKCKAGLQNLDTINSAKKYQCKCGKLYNTNCGLWKHTRKNSCNHENIEIDKDISKDTDIDISNDNDIDKNKYNENIIINESQHIEKLTNLIMEVVKSNTELQKQTMEMHQQMLEVCKNSNTTINNNHSNNKTFNMQVFLNEKCKDAMNIMDFVNSMTLDFSDLEELGELGYVEGISRQLIRKLSEMDVYKRPIHCSDLKRETMYVRDNDVWEKETEPYTNLRKLIKYITKKNGDLMIPWRNAHPQCMNLQHPLNDTYLAIMNQAMGGKGEFAESENKIIRKISKCVTIDKNDM